MCGKTLLLSLLTVLACSLVASAQIASFNEAPMLKRLVEAGDLPPVEQRLPEEDYIVVDVAEEIGEYGGTWHRMDDGPAVGWWRMVLYEPFTRWNEDYTAYIPGIAKSWEWDEDGKVFHLHLREGIKWSDGRPFTTEDIMFWWNDLVLHKDSPEQAPWWMFKNGERGTLEAVDDYTLRFEFSAPHWLISDVFASGFWESDPWLTPKHYLTQFHPDYAEDGDFVELDAKREYWHNPDAPVLFAWKTVIWEPGRRFVAERNPYYWKVDPEGNQLPYIDRVESTIAPEEEVRILKILSGEVDAQFRGVSIANFPVVVDNQERGGFRIVRWTSAAGGTPGFQINWTHKDPVIREMFRDQRFRLALSHAIDRETINQVAFYELGIPKQQTISRDSWHFQSPEGKKVFEEWSQLGVGYDPELSNRLLDEMGLEERGPNGFRLRLNGEPLQLAVHLSSTTNPVALTASEMVIDYWREVGINAVMDINEPAAHDLIRIENNMDIHMHGTSEMDIWTYPDWIFPVRPWRWAPAYGLWYSTGGAEGERPPKGGPVDQLLEIYEEGLETKSREVRHKLVHEAVRIHTEHGPFMIGVVGDTPVLVVAKENFRNIPDYGVLGPWAVGGPGNTNPPQYFIRQDQ